MPYKIILTFLLLGGAIFFLFEFFLHLFGLPILEHDKIFIPTHDRYIALYALTNAALLIVVCTNIKKYIFLFVIIMLGILGGMINAWVISFSGGYQVLFPSAVTIERQLSFLGVGFFFWYIAVWIVWLLLNNK